MKTEQTNTPDPQLRSQLDARSKKYDEAYDSNDAAAVASFFTEDAVLVTDRGPISGREAIEKYHADMFKQFQISNHIGKADQYSPHAIGTAGDEALARDRSSSHPVTRSICRPGRPSCHGKKIALYPVLRLRSQDRCNASAIPMRNGSDTLLSCKNAIPRTAEPKRK